MASSGQNRLVVDWDGTCVTIAWPKQGEWLPGAVRSLKEFVTDGWDVVIFSTRFAPTEVDEVTPRPEGMADEILGVRKMLDDAGLMDVQIWIKPWKPGGRFYIDDKGLEFQYWNDWRHNNWSAISDKVRTVRQAELIGR